VFYKNDMQRVNGLRIEDELRRKDEELASQRSPNADFDSATRPSRVRALISRIQRVVRR
jgi:hypothetical protein